MEIIIQPNAEDAAEMAERIITNLIVTNPQAVLGLATGSTPFVFTSVLPPRGSIGQVLQVSTSTNILESERSTLNPTALSCRKICFGM